MNELSGVFVTPPIVNLGVNPMLTAAGGGGQTADDSDNEVAFGLSYTHSANPHQHDKGNNNAQTSGNANTAAAARGDNVASPMPQSAARFAAALPPPPSSGPTRAILVNALAGYDMAEKEGGAARSEKGNAGGDEAEESAGNRRGGGNNNTNKYFLSAAPWVGGAEPSNPSRHNSLTNPSASEGGYATTMMTDEEIAANNRRQWHGLRVRIGVHFGMGDIRKDPVTLGYDYYGTVVNTAARVEGVGHGGQVLVTEEAFNALSDGFIRRNKVIAIALGPQPLRGLDEPIRLHQLAPIGLEGRRFPPLRLHIEKETEDTDLTETATTTNTASTGENMTPEELAARLCAGKQFQGISADHLILQYYFFLATFAPTTDKYKAGVIAKLGETWGFEKASKAAHVANEGHRTRLLVGLLGKIIRTFRASRKAKGVRNFAGNVTSGGGMGGTTSSRQDGSTHDGGGSTINGRVISGIHANSNHNNNNNAAAGARGANNNAYPHAAVVSRTSLSVSPQPSHRASRCATPSFANGQPPSPTGGNALFGANPYLQINSALQSNNVSPRNEQ